MAIRPSQGMRDFLNETKLLLLGCVFLTIGLFMIFTFFLTDIEYDERQGTVELARNTPVMLDLEQLEKGDVVYITVSAQDELDILVDSLDNGQKYVSTHDNYEPFTLPPSSYVASGVTSTTVKVEVKETHKSDDGYAMAIILQKTPYTSGASTVVKFSISYPNHMTQKMCVPVGVIFILGAVFCVAAHFVISWRSKRYQPLDTKKRNTERGQRSQAKKEGGLPMQGPDGNEKEGTITMKSQKKGRKKKKPEA